MFLTHQKLLQNCTSPVLDSKDGFHLFNLFPRLPPRNVEEMQGHICSIILLFAGLLLELHVKSSEVWQGLLPVHLGARYYSLPGVDLKQYFHKYPDISIEIFLLHYSL